MCSEALRHIVPFGCTEVTSAAVTNRLKLPHIGQVVLGTRSSA